ncbi:hypothetical protein ZPAH1_orf00364 [Aeromonas phage ZPAH1]|nr:hypothetical protein ASwh1_318 [Aeromonas phage Aswh_1]QQG34126.1 hypothetical protein ZPAH1_orf00364 [Aeromonas phage ZPAH1]
MIVNYGDVKVYTGPHVKDICQYLLDNKMYVDGWSLKGFFNRVIKRSERIITKVAVKYIDGVPVGLATRGIMNGYTNFVMCYVKEEHRGAKIGSELVNLIKVGDKKYWAYTGYSWSQLFWESVGVVSYSKIRY